MVPMILGIPKAILWVFPVKKKLVSIFGTPIEGDYHILLHLTGVESTQACAKISWWTLPAPRLRGTWMQATRKVEGLRFRVASLGFGMLGFRVWGSRRMKQGILHSPNYQGNCCDVHDTITTSMVFTIAVTITITNTGIIPITFTIIVSITTTILPNIKVHGLG